VRRRRRRWAAPATTGLLAYLALVGMVTVLTGVGVLPRWPGAAHLVALPPLDVAADTRVLVARAPSWPVFTTLLVGGLALRITVLALLLGGARFPRWRLAAGMYAVATPVVLLASQLDFVAHAALYSRLFGAALGVLAVCFLALAAAPWVGASRVGVPRSERRPRVRSLEPRIGAAVRDAARQGFRVADLLVYVLGLFGLGALVQTAGATASVLSIPVAALWTVVFMGRLLGPPPHRPLRRLAGASVLGLAMFAVVVVTRGAPWMVSDASRDGSVLVMSGINSASGEGAVFEVEPERIGYRCEQFVYYSYAGPGDGQPQGDAACPKTSGAPYVPEDTQRPFDEQVALLEEQAADLDPPLVVLAHSQAAWVAWQAAADGQLPGPAHLVLIGAFPSSPLTYPPPGETGPGFVGGEGFRWLIPLADWADFDFTVDAPLARELLATPDAAADVFAQPLPGDVEALAVTATSDLALMPDGWRIDGAVDACPIREAHPYLPITPAFHRVVDRFLAGERDGSCPPWPEVYRVGVQAFGAPPHDR
jgi:hypothetical protein